MIRTYTAKIFGLTSLGCNFYDNFLQKAPTTVLFCTGLEAKMQRKTFFSLLRFVPVLGRILYHRSFRKQNRALYMVINILPRTGRNKNKTE